MYNEKKSGKTRITFHRRQIWLRLVRYTISDCGRPLDFVRGKILSLAHSKKKDEEETKKEMKGMNSMEMSLKKGEGVS